MSLVALSVCLLLPVVTVWLFGVFVVLLSTRGQPGYIAIVQPFLEFGQGFLPYHWRFNLQAGLLWKLKTQLFEKYNSDILVIPSLFPPIVTVLVSNPEAISHINKDRHSFAKDEISNTRVASLMGPNILTTEGPAWRKHRKVVVSAFSERNVAIVWSATLATVNEWMDRIQGRAGEGSKIVVNHSESSWALVTLLVMAQAGFGTNFEWPSSLSNSNDTMSNGQDAFFDSASSILKNWISLVAFPKLFFRPIPLTAKLGEMDKQKMTFETELKRLIKTRIDEAKQAKVDGVEVGSDILSLLCMANLREEGAERLTDEELLGNAFIFLLAGSETSAGTLSAVFAFLAIYPSHQARIHQEAVKQFDSRYPISYPNTYNHLHYTLAVIKETLRLAGPAQTLSKRATCDTTLTSTSIDGHTTSTIFVPTGSWIRENVLGSHYSSQNWTDVLDFKPDRFLEDEDAKKGSEPKAWLPFSSGQRGCIGRQFALVEMVAIVASVLLRYKIEVPDHNKEEWKMKAGESQNGYRNRVLKPHNLFTLGPQQIDLVFVPRISTDKKID